jgi:DnaJ-class molecular chaperone
MIDYYDMFGVTQEVSQDELRSAYRRLAAECHPDRNPGNPGAEQVFREISQAYDVLSDQGRRKEYDLARSKDPLQNILESVSEAFEPFAETMANAVDIFSSFPTQNRSSCTVCRGSGSVAVIFGPLQLLKSCSACVKS